MDVTTRENKQSNM